jgi:undecaprenyl-diphosphatase
MHWLFEFELNLLITTNLWAANNSFQTFFYYYNQFWGWIAVLIPLSILTFRQFGMAAFRVFLAVALSWGLSDGITSGILKPTVRRIRPCHEADIPVITYENKCGGIFGFPSSHAANAMAVAYSFYYSIKISYIRMFFLLSWALLQGIGRIFLAVHYPSDVLVGFLIGYGVARIVQKIMNYWLPLQQR